MKVLDGKLGMKGRMRKEADCVLEVVLAFTAFRNAKEKNARGPARARFIDAVSALYHCVLERRLETVN